MIKVSAPGRICLFGEHQDYLGLPVIAMAINLRIQLIATPRKDKIFHIELPDINDKIDLDFTEDKEFKYTNNRDYFRSVYNVLFRDGVRFRRGYNCTITSKIPINSGTSSSSALVNVWCRFLLEVAENLAEENKTPTTVGTVSYFAEVKEFNEAGGMMDQLSTAVGRLSYIDISSNGRMDILPAKLGTFVLGDSCESKATQEILKKTKEPALRVAKKLNLDYRTAQIDLISKEILSKKDYTVARAVIKNREITKTASNLLRLRNTNHKMIGDFLLVHHGILAKELNISTPKIDKMLYAAISAGAYGGKINGSGGGGCMFAYAPENPERVAEAIEDAGGKAYIVKMDEGLKLTKENK